jgi:rod shape determining protein RodA
MMALMAIGVLFIYSACYRGEGLPMESFHVKQVFWGAVGILCFLRLALFDYHRLGDAAWFIYATAIALLVLVLLIGVEHSGATRWLNLFGKDVQPSEFAKIGILISLAWFLSRPGTNPARPVTIVVTGAVSIVPFLLIFIQPDLGTAAVLVPLVFVLLYASGVPLRTLGILVLLGLVLLPLGSLVLQDYQVSRIKVFFDPSHEPFGAGWNKIQSTIAVGSGGLAGKGYLEGTQNVLGYLPSKVAPSDFIYSVIAEETGFIGSTLVLSLYAAVLIGAIRAALVSKDKFGRLLAVGVATLIFSHVFVNISMTIGLLPIAGLPLPLLSYGGSFMVSTMCGLGIVQSVYVRRLRR